MSRRPEGLYVAVLAHYGVVADPGRVGDPDRKGTVENAISTLRARPEALTAHTI